MKRYFPINNAYLLSIVLLCSAVIYADDTIDENECPVVMPNFDDMILLTREERIQLMDQALKDALSQVQDCRQRLGEKQNQNSNAASSASSSENSDNTDTNQSEENASNGEDQQTATPSTDETQNQQTAVPSGELSGTETSEQTNTQPTQTPTPNNELSGSEPEKPDPKSATGKLPEQQVPDQTATQPEDQSTVKDNEKATGSGKLPEDIPPADNDDIIAKQIREAALSESDPEKQARLWNEYRRYKEISEK